MNEFIRKVDSLSEFDKYRLWFRYLRSHYSLKYSTQIILDRERDEEHYNKILPKLKLYNYRWRYNTIIITWKNDLSREREPIDFVNFCKNIKKVELGDWWKEQGFAQKSWIDYPMDSIYYWYSRC